MINKKLNFKIGVFVVSFFFLIFLSTNVFAEKNNLTDYEKASICMNESKGIIVEMNQSNFSIERINDSLYELEKLFEAQNILKKQKRNPDFSLIFPYCEDIVNVRDFALEATDEFKGLIKFYNVFIEDGMNTTSIDEIFSEIRGEIKSERYEKVSPLIKKGYDEIANVRAENTALKLFYNTTTRGVKDFFVDNWIAFMIGVGVLLVLFLVYRTAIIKKKIEKLEMKREIFNKLIGKTQKDYFEGGKMSENDYMIKTKKFSEMIRDIDRQIPLLKVNYIKIEETNKNVDKEKRLKEKEIVKKKTKKTKK